MKLRLSNKTIQLSKVRRVRSVGNLAIITLKKYEVVDTEDKRFVEGIAEEMGISVAPVEVIVINADVNRDGYVDLYDVLIVRSGMQKSVSYDTDINNDGVTNEVDLLIVKAKAVEAITAASPSKRKIEITTRGSLKSKSY